MKKFIKNLLVIVPVFVVLLMVFVRFTYSYVLYPSPRDSGPVVPEGFEMINLDGVEFLYSPSEDDTKTIVYFHGNNETLSDITYIAQKYADYGLGIAMMEYPGYGDLDGDATEEAIYASADKVFDYLKEQGIPNEKIVVIGYSLGTGVATEMVYRGFGSGLVLIAPYTSVPDVAQRFIPFLPVDFLIPEHFDTYEKAVSIDLSTLIIHGTADMTIPYDMGVELSQVFENVQFVTQEGKGHHDYFDDKTIGLVAEFVRGKKAIGNRQKARKSSKFSPYNMLRSRLFRDDRENRLSRWFFGNLRMCVARIVADFGGGSGRDVFGPDCVSGEVFFVCDKVLILAV